MPIFTLTPDSYNALQYNLARPTLVQFELRASHPVKSYFMALPEYQLFLKGDRLTILAGTLMLDRFKAKQSGSLLPVPGIW